MHLLLDIEGLSMPMSGGGGGSVDGTNGDTCGGGGGGGGSLDGAVGDASGSRGGGGVWVINGVVANTSGGE